MKKEPLYKAISTVCAAVGLSATPVTLIAQDSGGSSPSAGVIEEIIVTARRRSESIQEVPISVTAFTEDEVAVRGNLRVLDVAQLVPNLTFVSTANSNLTNFTIRGIQAFPRASRAGFESAAPTYIDGVVRSRPSAVNQFLTDLETIEFLRGPQGTLFGRGSIAGALNITTKTPGEELEGSIDVQAGNYNLRQAQGYISGPIIKNKLSGSVAAFSQKRDGFDDNLFDGSDLANADIYGGRIKLYATPTEGLSMQLTVDYSEEDVRGPAVQYLDGPFATGIERTTNIDIPTVAESEQVGLDFTVNYDLPSLEATLTSISSVRNFESYRSLDFSFLPPAVPAFGEIYTFSTPDEDQVTQEFRLTSTWDRALDYVIGFYYFKAELDDNIVAVLPFLGPPNSVSASTVETESYSLFANFDWHINEQLSLFFGGRYTQEDRTLTQQQDPGSGALIGTPFFPLQTDDQDADEFLPTVGVRYAMNDNINFYATAARGYRGGGWNNKEIAGRGEIETFADLAFASEEVWSYELGAKTSWLDNRLILNAAVFYSDYEDIQSDVRRLVNILGSPTLVGRVDNAGAATISGFELELRAQVTEGLSIRGGIGHTSAEFDEFDTFDLVGNPVSFKDNTLELVPDYTANFGLLYNRPLANDMSLVVSMDVAYTDELFTDPANDPMRSIESRTLTNGRIGIRGGGSHQWEVFLWANNAFDEVYLTGRAPSPFGTTASYSPPRQAGVRLALHF